MHSSVQSATVCAPNSTPRDNNGRYAGFKRVVVTDARVAPEEPPNRETLTLFLLFQIAARDSGASPTSSKSDHAIVRRVVAPVESVDRCCAL